MTCTGRLCPTHKLNFDKEYPARELMRGGACIPPQSWRTENIFHALRQEVVALSPPRSLSHCLPAQILCPHLRPSIWEPGAHPALSRWLPIELCQHPPRTRHWAGFCRCFLWSDRSWQKHVWGCEAILPTKHSPLSTDWHCLARRWGCSYGSLGGWLRSFLRASPLLPAGQRPQERKEGLVLFLFIYF